MNIVEPYARMIGISTQEQGIELLRKVEWCGRISHRSEDGQSDTSWDRFIRAVVIQHGDWSIVEHASVSVDMLVDRGVTHELVRHRLFAFTQESTRFVNYEKKMPAAFIAPPMPPTAIPIWELAIEEDERRYRALLAEGCTPQIARSVLPNALASRIIITGNLRNWRYFLLARTSAETHPQMKQVTIPLLAQFQAVIPILFEDIVPQEKQSKAFSKPR